MSTTRGSLRLRSRVSLYFSLTALAATLGLALVTYTVARSFLLDQRGSLARTQAFANAKVVNDQLLADPSTVGAVMPRLRIEGDGFASLSLGSQSFLTDARYAAAEMPASLRQSITDRRSGQQYTSINGRPYLVVGIYLASRQAGYFEAFPMSNTDRTLRAIAAAMAIGAVVTTLIGAGLGWWASRRLLRPVTRVATAAGELASGGLDTRMLPEADPDLNRLATSFNDMADAVQARIQREARFASDVSHELRSPITALAAAIEVLDARRTELPERSRQALDVVVTQVHRFDQMVLDLLELSRLDVGSTEVRRESVDPYQFTRRIAQRYGFDEVPISLGQGVPERINVDKLRYERILANLLDNAKHHAGGPTSVWIESQGPEAIVLTVCDHGPGVARTERTRIFERFARGSAARHRSGTGLGLALVAEHAAAHGGHAWVTDRPGGGACFKVSLGGVQ